MSIDNILKEIGEFGPYQKRVYALVCLPSFVLAALLVVQVFLLGTPDHRCKIPGYHNDTYESQGPAHNDEVTRWIPADDTGKYEYDRCHIYTKNHTTDNSTNKIKCTEWVYDMTVYKDTFTKKLDMVCDDAIKIPNAQMIFFFGVLSGSLVYGQISDLIGRRKTLYIALVIQLGSSVGLIGMVEYIGFCVLMFLMGGATLGVYMTSYVIGMELVGSKKRLWTGTVIALFLTTGQLYLVLMVYLIRDWKYFTLAVALPGCLFLPYYWFVCSMSYYGVVLNTANLGGDLYLNFVLLTVVEYPGKLLTMLLLDRVGRKLLYTGFLVVGGIACIATIWPIAVGSDELHYVLITLAMVGKLCITGAFDSLYVFSAEIFPTVVRNAGMGSSSAAARVGSMIAPYIAKSADLVSGSIGKAIPLTVFGVTMFIAGLLTLCLPETLNRELPENISDVENLRRKMSEVIKKRKTVGETNVTVNDGFSNIEEDHRF